MQFSLVVICKLIVCLNLFKFFKHFLFRSSGYKADNNNNCYSYDKCRKQFIDCKYTAKLCDDIFPQENHDTAGYHTRKNTVTVRTLSIESIRERLQLIHAHGIKNVRVLDRTEFRRTRPARTKPFL